MNKKAKIEKLKAELEELKKRDPSHCYGREGHIPHSMTPELFQQIEDLEEKIKELERL